MVGQHYQLNGHDFEQTAGVDGGQGGLAYHNPWGCKESDMTERLNLTTQAVKGVDHGWGLICGSKFFSKLTGY